ncbi:hypothetical protein RUND412_002502 [Rhizina undulata]
MNNCNVGTSNDYLLVPTKDAPMIVKGREYLGNHEWSTKHFSPSTTCVVQDPLSQIINGLGLEDLLEFEDWKEEVLRDFCGKGRRRSKLKSGWKGNLFPTGDSELKYVVDLFQKEEVLCDLVFTGYLEESVDEEGLEALKVDDVTWWVCMEEASELQKQRLPRILREYKSWVALNLNKMRHCDPCLAEHNLYPRENAVCKLARLRKLLAPKEMPWAKDYISSLLGSDPPIISPIDEYRQTSNVTLAPKYQFRVTEFSVYSLCLGNQESAGSFKEVSGKPLVYLDNVEIGDGKQYLDYSIPVNPEGLLETDQKSIDAKLDQLEFVVFPAFKKGNMSINAAKSPLAKKKKTLGYVLSRHGISKLPELTSYVIKSFSAATNPSEHRSVRYRGIPLPTPEYKFAWQCAYGNSSEHSANIDIMESDPHSEGSIRYEDFEGEGNGGKYPGSNSDAGSDDPYSHPTRGNDYRAESLTASMLLWGGGPTHQIPSTSFRDKALCQVIQPGHMKHETIEIHNQTTIHNKLLSRLYDGLYIHLDWGLAQKLILNVHKNLREGYLSHQATITGQKQKRGRPVRVKKEEEGRNAQGIREAPRPKTAPS